MHPTINMLLKKTTWPYLYTYSLYKVLKTAINTRFILKLLIKMRLKEQRLVWLIVNKFLDNKVNRMTNCLDHYVLALPLLFFNTGVRWSFMWVNFFRARESKNMLAGLWSFSKHLMIKITLECSGFSELKIRLVSVNFSICIFIRIWSSALFSFPSTLLSLRLWKKLLLF